ncbi:hypothetical protein EDB84DRAFT_1529098, partial [Lactarius hengduanensis]
MATHLRRILQITILHTASKCSFALHLDGLASGLSVPIFPLRLPPPCTMPSFMRRFKQSQNLDIKDTLSLMHSPSTISSTSQSSISISLRRRM